MTEPPQPLDPQLCPVCGKANQCAMELEKETGIAQPPCWCTLVSFSASLLASVPVASQGLACVCSVCATSSRPSESIH